ncbi:MAG: DUF2147 domain-containing protein [Bacteroidia bacterium]
MTRLKMILCCLFAHFAIMAASQTVKSDEIIGTWVTQTGNSKITIFKNGNYFYGKVSWMRHPSKEDGKPKTDENNPDEKLRSRQILGMMLLKGFEFDEKDQEWLNGEIYDPKSGKTYSCTLKLTDHNTLSVHGYIGISLIGRTEIWTRSK